MKNILIIDNSNIDAKLFSDMFKIYGFNSQISDGNNFDIIEYISIRNPSLILIDIQLSNNYAIEYNEILVNNKNFNKIPVLATTALSLDKKHISDAGFSGIINKPISIPCFFNEIRRFLMLRYFQITDALIVGHKEIDDDHAYIIKLYNQFLDNVAVHDVGSAISTYKNILIAIKEHFIREEKIMADYGYNELPANKKHHEMSLNKYSKLFDYGSKVSMNNIADKLVLILLEDFLKADQGFKEYLKKIKN